MIKKRLSSGVSHAMIAFLLLPLAIGGVTYVAANASAMWNPGTTPTLAPPAGYGIHGKPAPGYWNNVSTVNIEGTVVAVNVSPGEPATLTVAEDNGKTVTVLIGGLWIMNNETVLTPPELAGRVKAGDHVLITAFTACDNDVRAVKIEAAGTTYVLLHGPQAHEFYGYGGWAAYHRPHHEVGGQCPCPCPCCNHYRG